jgi:DNA polymerase-3 subunit delta
MPASTAKQSAVVMVCGDDEFGVKQRAKAIYAEWTAELGGMDHEIVDAAVANSGEAAKALARLREALQTLPFFGSGKVVWLQNCNFLGDERAASTQIVTETLSVLAQELKELPWDNLRLLISAGKVDKRKSFYKAIDKLGKVESFAALSMDDRDWAAQAESLAHKAFRSRGKEINDEALAEFITRIGPNARQLDSEAEKLALYTGDKASVSMDDVLSVTTRNKNARAFALGDALGDRDLPRLLRRLDEELWEVKLDPQRSEIGLLYGLISKIRAMLMLKEMLREGWVKADSDYNRFKSQLERVPADQLPADRRFNPLAINPYVLYKALPQARKYSQGELIRAMGLLLDCNLRLVSANIDEALVLQQALVQIVQGNEGASDAGSTGNRISAERISAVQ